MYQQHMFSMGKYENSSLNHIFIFDLSGTLVDMYVKGRLDKRRTSLKDC